MQSYDVILLQEVKIDKGICIPLLNEKSIRPQFVYNSNKLVKKYGVIQKAAEYGEKVHGQSLIVSYIHMVIFWN